MKRVVIFGFSANPPANHHLAIIQELFKVFGKIIVIPRGTDQNKLSIAATTHNQRRDMVNLMFSDLPNIEIDPVRSSLAEVLRTRALGASETSYGIHYSL